MDKKELQYLVDIFLGALISEVQTKTKKLSDLIIAGATEEELMQSQLELAELVHWLSTTGLLGALRTHWPAMNELFDRLLKLRQDKEIVEELNYLITVNERKSGNGNYP